MALSCETFHSWSVISSPASTELLMLTGALNKQAGTRLAETTKWWVDITEERGLERLHAGFTSTIYVRFIHALVRHQLQKAKTGILQHVGAPNESI